MPAFHDAVHCRRLRGGEVELLGQPRERTAMLAILGASVRAQHTIGGEAERAAHEEGAQQEHQRETA
jgi:hypothetical protein